MTKSRVDELFGRALTDRRFRVRLLANARDATDGYALTDEERQQVVAWTAETFDGITRELETRVERSRFDGFGFQTDAGPDSPALVSRALHPAALNRLMASVLPDLAQSPDRPRADGPAISEATTLETREARLRDAGILRRLGESVVQDGDHRLHVCSAIYGGPYSDQRYVLPNVCGGRGTTPRLARARALSEAAERFAGAVYDERAFVLGSFRHLAADAVPSSAFALFSAAQYAEPDFPYVPFTESTPVNWTWGYSLLQRRRVLVPAAFVYRPYWPGGHEARLADLPTTGLACGRSLEEATINGLYEIIERDAIVIAWLNRLPVPRIAVEGAGWTSDSGRTLSVHDITTDLTIPTRLAIVIDRSAAIVSAGAAAQLDGREATDKAVAEALMIESVLRSITSRPSQSPAATSEVETLEDHMLFYCNAERMRELDFLLQAPTSATEAASREAAREPLDELRVVLEMLRQRSLDAIVVDVTLPEIAAAGLHVVRTVVPGLIPLTFGQRFAAKGGERLYQVPVRLGYRETPLREDQLNPAPHPFA